MSIAFDESTARTAPAPLQRPRRTMPEAQEYLS